jgi:D-xylose 1-dehydrogenase
VFATWIAVNLQHHFFAARAVAEMMRDGGGGSIMDGGWM